MRIAGFLFFCFFTLYSFSYSYDILNNGSEDEYSAKCGSFMSKEQKFRICQITDNNKRPVNQTQYSAPGGRFVIHYDTTGKNAVDLTDKNNNGIPDYVDSVAYYFNYAYLMEVDSLKYLPPAPDSGRGGSDAYDVYLLEIGDGFNGNVWYGFTTQEDSIYPLGKFIRYTSFIAIDNNFSSLDSTLLSSGKKAKTFNDTGIAAMKITAAHEFHHALQLMYGEDQSCPSLYEVTSTYMEHRLFPETTDYFQFVKSLFSNLNRYTFGNGSPENGYRFCIFGQFMERNFGDSLLRRMWEILSTGRTGYQALNDAFIERNTSLVKEWCNFMPWLYYTGHRTIEGSFFTQAKEFPLLKFFSDTVFSSPTFSTSEALKPFEIRAFRVKFAPEDPAKTNDTLDIVITNTDLKAVLNQMGYQRTRPFDILCTETYIPTSKQIGKNKYYTFIADSGDVFDTLFINNGFITNLINYSYPNPYRRDVYSEMMFPAPVNAALGDYAKLQIFTTGMEKIYYNNQLKVDVDSGNKIIALNPFPDVITDGIYIFSVEWKNDILYGKFTVVK